MRSRYPRLPLLPMIRMFGLFEGFKMWLGDQRVGNIIDVANGHKPTITFR